MQKERRLTSRDDFSKVYRYGKSQANHQFVVYFLFRRDTEKFRMGVSASKKIGNAVVRNRLRRLVKEIVRLHADSIVSQVDFVIIVRKPAVELDFKQLEKSMIHVLKRANLLIKK